MQSTFNKSFTSHYPSYKRPYELWEALLTETAYLRFSRWTAKKLKWCCFGWIAFNNKIILPIANVENKSWVRLNMKRIIHKMSTSSKHSIHFANWTFNECQKKQTNIDWINMLHMVRKHQWGSYFSKSIIFSE